MKDESMKEKFSSFCRKIGKRNFIIAASFVVVAAALIVGITVFSKQDKGFDYSQGVGLNDTNRNEETANKDTDKNSSAADTYFSSVQVNRQRTRDEALEVLQGVVDNQDSTAAAKEEALAEINKMAKIMEAEANIETLVVAKGFAECVAVISEDGASVVVKSEGLQAAQISQINEIVYEQSGILPVNVKIIQR